MPTNPSKIVIGSFLLISFILSAICYAIGSGVQVDHPSGSIITP